MTASVDLHKVFYAFLILVAAYVLVFWNRLRITFFFFGQSIMMKTEGICKMEMIENAALKKFTTSRLICSTIIRTKFTIAHPY